MHLPEWLYELAYSPIFPEELWGLIIDKITDPDDVGNLLNSINNLSSKFNLIKIHKYFQKVLPILLKHSIFEGKEILRCRLVSSQWRQAIDCFFETLEPMSQPYTDFSSVAQRITEIDLKTGIVNRPTVCCQTAADIYLLGNEMDKYTRNPFVGRAVKLFLRADLLESIEASDHELASVEFVRAAHWFLRKFGHHIRFAVLNFGLLYAGEDDIIARNTYRRVIQCISYLLNASSIKISFQLFDDCPHISQFDAIVARHLPNMFQNLKSFQLMGSSQLPMSSLKCVLQRIFEHSDLFSFGLPLRLWRSEYTKYLTNITDLVVDAERSGSYQKLPKILEACKSVKNLKLVPCGEQQKILNLSELLIYMHGLNIRSLDIANHKWYMKLFTPSSTEKQILKSSTVESISLYDTLGIRYNFLRLLPRLNFLKIYASGLLDENDIPKHRKLNDVTTVLRTYVYAATVRGDLSIWKLLPNLNILTIVCNNVHIKQFRRESKNKCFLQRL